MTHPIAYEHEDEPVPGLPGRLPPGEEILWQGAPSARLIARRALKTRWIAGYFALLGVWTLLAGLADGRTPGGLAFAVGVLAVLAALVLGLLELYAYGVERTTLYTITNRRVVLRVGVALSKTLNVPFRQVASADVLRYPGGGNIALSLSGDSRFALMVLWPHARPWRWKKPEPMLRGLADPDAPAAILARALEAHGGAAAAQAADDAQADVKPDVKAGEPGGFVPGRHPVAAE